MKFQDIRTSIKERINDPLLPIWAGAFMDIMGIMILGPYLPRYLLDLGIPIANIGLILSINVFIGFFSGIMWGALSDRYGRRPILIICRVGTLASYVLLAFATTLPMIILVRVVDGLFTRVLQVSLTIVGDVTPPERRTREMSTMGIGWIIGGLIGPSIGALLYRFGMQGIGLTAAALTGTSLLLVLLKVRESHPRLTNADVPAEEWVAGSKPIFSTKLLKQKMPRLRLSQSMFNAMSHFIFRSAITLFVTTRFGFSVAQIGEMLTLNAILNLVVRLFIFPYVLRKLGDARILMFGFSVFLATFIWLVFLDSPWEYFITITMVSFATTCTVDVMTGIMSQEVRKEDLGEMIGLNVAAESIGLVIAPIIGSYLIAQPNPYYYGLAAVVISTVPIILEYRFVVKRRRE